MKTAMLKTPPATEPPGALELLRQQARNQVRRIILPEQDDPRVLEAATTLVEQGLGVPVFLSPLKKPIPGCEIFWDRQDAERWFEQAASIYAQSRKNNPISLEQSREALTNPLLLAAVLLRIGYVDCGVAGAANTTADVLRACIRGVGLSPGSRLISSAFLMELPDRLLTYGDCAVNPCPNTEQLAQIATDSAATHHALTGQEPKVALLSFSTKGSAEHDQVDKVRQALSIAKAKAPNLAIDGELQFDAAFVSEIGAAKAGDSPIAGQANVFIFPDLSSGNIGYKITERIGGANAIGPVLQGLDKPWLDLSRGCKGEDIVNAAVIAATLSIHSAH